MGIVKHCTHEFLIFWQKEYYICGDCEAVFLVGYADPNMREKWKEWVIKTHGLKFPNNKGEEE